jgi:hypothetical protein
MTTTINITGGTYKNKSLPLSAQRTVNFWPQLQSPKSKSPYVLETFPGKTVFGTVTGSRDRGMLEHLDVLYKVTDTTFYTVDTMGVHTSRGTIPGIDRCIMTGIGSNVVIVTGGTPYVWNGSALSVVNDADLESPNSCAHLNNQILYDGDGGRFASSDVGDATSIDALNYATAESDADELVRIYVHDQRALMMGSKTIEPWWNSGNGQPPFDRLEGSIIQIGLGALHSVANSKEYVYFVGNDNIAYALKGSYATPIFNDAIIAEITDSAMVSDAEGMCYNINGQWFYELSFPTLNRTFCHPEGGETFELSSGTEGGRNIASSYAYFNRKHLVGDCNSGNIYELDLNTYTENSNTIIRYRDTAPLHGGLFGASGKTLIMNRFELIMEVGVGLLSGQGIDPMVMLSFSDDGKTFSTEMWAPIGRIGQFLYKVEWFALGSFESRVIRVRVSDPVHWSIHSAAADIEVCI